MVVQMYTCKCIGSSRLGSIMSVTCEGSEFDIVFYYDNAKVGNACFA
jgi:hypothetical protein